MEGGRKERRGGEVGRRIDGGNEERRGGVMGELMEGRKQGFGGGWSDGGREGEKERPHTYLLISTSGTLISPIHLYLTPTPSSPPSTPHTSPLAHQI
ncbi:hypothetical protein Pmani_019849 [Petrolisthes manimaculis]|uniref:Uncharacterized protein n=1 Tax=Petrolisthes manimaculis TaxID=1843537 RepID=A0AAE1PI39_9EUCA|nr:hypothetical protein Pmani_019849 [Petrolisthes manimaculis]